MSTASKIVAAAKDAVSSATATVKATAQKAAEVVTGKSTSDDKAAPRAPVLAAHRQLASVRSIEGKVLSQIVQPAVFCAPIRPDIVHDVHRNIAKNKRQPYAVSAEAGHQHSAHS